MNLRMVEALSKVSHIVVMKDSSGSAMDFAHFGDCDFDIFVGFVGTLPFPLGYAILLEKRI